MFQTPGIRTAIIFLEQRVELGRRHPMAGRILLARILQVVAAMYIGPLLVRVAGLLCWARLTVITMLRCKFGATKVIPSGIAMDPID